MASDINNYAGDLVQHNSTVPTRLNPSFGSIAYTQNDRQSRFDALIVGVRTRFAKNGFINAYYTRSSSQDDTQVYPVATNPYQYYGPSIWDSTNRLSLTASYTIPGLNQGHGLTGHVTGGWTASAVTILQSGHPFTVNTTAAFQPVRDANGKITGLSAASGDYNADGDNNDYPNVASYTMATGRQTYLTGVIHQVELHRSRPWVPRAMRNGANSATRVSRRPTSACRRTPSSRRDCGCNCGSSSTMCSTA